MSYYFAALMQEFIIQYRRNKEKYVVNLNLKKQSSILCLNELLEKKKRCHSKWSCVDIWFMLAAHVAQYGPFLYSASSEAFLIYFWLTIRFVYSCTIQGDYSFQSCLRMWVLHVYWIFIDRSAERRSEM